MVFKRLIRLSSGAVVQLINSLFDANHPLDSTVEYPNTETVSDKLRKLMSDAMIVINGTHVYNIESEIGYDAGIVIRIFEYGYAEALRSMAVSENGAAVDLTFPNARVIYWEARAPEKLTLRMHFPDGSWHSYEVPTFNFLAHSVAELEERKLTMLLPFYVLKLRKRLERAASSTAAMENLRRPMLL
jgi:hypothetical protein